jgi:hypothetical protein
MRLEQASIALFRLTSDTVYVERKAKLTSKYHTLLTVPISFERMDSQSTVIEQFADCQQSAGYSETTTMIREYKENLKYFIRRVTVHS